MKVSDRIISDPLFDLLVYGIFAAGCAGPVLLIGQVWVWLKSGVWPDWDVGLLLVWMGADPSGIEWLGLRKLALGLADIGLWLAQPLCGKPALSAF